MKTPKLIFLILFLTMLYSCAPPVTFEEPQPANTSTVANFPKRLQGQYLSLEDSSILLIDDQLIQRVYDYDYTIHASQLDTATMIVGDTLYDQKGSKKYLFKNVGDSLVTHIHNIDTLFKIDEYNVVKKFKGYYFLNTRHDNESWEVKKMQLIKGQLIISNINTERELENLKEVAETSQDTVTPYKFKASKKQFKEFLNNNGFSESETFIRLR